MAFEQRDMSGALFRNDRKVKGDNKPDYTGKAMVNGKMVEISAWIKPIQSKPGQNFMSLSFKPPRDQQQGQQGMGEYQGEDTQAQRGTRPQPLRPVRQPEPPMEDIEGADLPF